MPYDKNGEYYEHYTYVKIDVDTIRIPDDYENELLINDTKDIQFDSIYDAVKYAEGNFNLDIKSFGIKIYGDEFGKCETQTIKRDNDRLSNDKPFIYSVWDLSIENKKLGGYNYELEEYNTAKACLECNKAKIQKAIANGYDVRIESYTKTLYELIGESVAIYTVKDTQNNGLVLIAEENAQDLLHI